MKFLLPMILLIGVVLLMGGLNREGFRSARAVLSVVGFMLLLAIVFAFVVKNAF